MQEAIASRCPAPRLCQNGLFVRTSYQVVALAVGVALCGAPLRPVELLTVQAAFSVLQCALLNLQDVGYPVKSTRAHPMAGMARALQSLRHNAAWQRANSESAMASKGKADSEIRGSLSGETAGMLNDLEA